MIEVRDNFFKPDLCNLIARGAEAYQWRYWRPVVDDDDVQRTFVSFLWNEESEANFFHILWKMIQKEFATLKECYCYRIIANGQVKSQNIDWHTDHSDKTAVYYPMVWNPEWGGSMLCKIADTEQEIKYQQNRIVVFDAGVRHYASCPIVENVLRVSIAFNLRFNDAKTPGAK